MELGSKIKFFIWRILGINRLMNDIRNNYESHRQLCFEVTELKKRCDRIESELNNKLGAGAPGGQE